MSKEIEKLDKRIEQLKKRRQLLDTKLREKQRKQETRKKIIIGGLVLSACKDGKWPEDDLKTLLDKSLTHEKDRELFNLDNNK